MEISSSQNERIKFVKKLYRRRYRDEYGLYLAEGLRLVEDLCVTSSVRELYYTKKLTVSERGEAAAGPNRGRDRRPCVPVHREGVWRDQRYGR